MYLKKAIIMGLFVFLGLGFLSVKDMVAQGKIEKVIVTGMGLTETKAINTATKNAIQQVVGMYVVSEEVMKNQELIKDEVLSYSNAYVRSFKVLKKSKDEDGLIEIRAQVEVEIGKLANKLQDLNISIKAIETGEFYAVSVDKLSSAQSFKKMAQKVIFEPIKQRKKIHAIKILSFTPLDALPKIRVGHGWVEWKQGDKSRYKAGELIPIRLDFKISLNDDYLNPVLQFLEKSSKKVHTQHEFFRYDNWYEKYYLIPFFEPTTNNSPFKRRLIKAFELEKGKAELLKTLWGVLPGKDSSLFLEITLLDSNKSELGRLVYKARSKKLEIIKHDSSISALSFPYFSHGQEKFICQTNPYPRALVTGFPYMGVGFAKNNATFHVILFLDEKKIESVKALKIELLFG